MDKSKPCRCCLAQGLHKDLNSSYVWLNKTEVYSKMLQECFNIVISNLPQVGSGICDTCVSSLRAAQEFKRTVLKAELELMKREVFGKDEKPVEVKLEPKQDSDVDSDDYFLADAVSVKEDIDIEDTKLIKLEVDLPKKKPLHNKNKKVVKKVKSSSDWSDGNIKNLVSKLTRMGNGDELTIKKKKNTKEPKMRTIIIKPEPYTQSKYNIVWQTQGKTHKIKHKENLITMLEYSNIVPFKDKTLLGYTCGYCDSTFPDPQDLRMHTDDIHKKERLNYKTRFDMTEYHVKVDITDLTCNLCEEKIENLSLLREHLSKTHDKLIHNDINDHVLQFKLKKGEIYDCAMCSATYETFKMLKQHMNKHYCNYTCDTCEATFATKRSLNAHRTTHSEGSFKCDQCDKVFPSKAKKQYHEKSKHMGARNISNCPYCNEPFRSYYQRNQHLIKVHNSEAQYKCNVCNKSYVLKSLLMYHIKKSHLMERDNQCADCGYRFFSKKALKAHMVKHTGERNFACHVCNKAYARKYTLREHMRIHENDRRFKCEVCSMSFVQKCSLKSHLLSNHGISMAASDITCVSSVSQE